MRRCSARRIPLFSGVLQAVLVSIFSKEFELFIVSDELFCEKPNFSESKEIKSCASFSVRLFTMLFKLIGVADEEGFENVRELLRESGIPL